ncbi:PAS domain S-box protein [Desulfamplus magnetovallimortis]|uniref:PAS domain S-box protein n=1 Tax=Desulfamplus magnetovallimortis TaxID=1246637 RepID=UPI0009BA1230|nr:PAS domain S-box protein [Desulfamplus magnetovallimortis]
MPDKKSINPCDLVCEIDKIKKRLMGWERAVVENEANFQAIIENAPVMINSFDETGRCLLWNRKSEDMLGWSREELMDCKDPLSLFYPSCQSRDKVFENIKNPDGIFRVYEVMAKDGTQRIQEWANFKLPNGMLISFGIDITEKKEVEENLRKNEARFRAFTEAIPDILFVFDIDGQYVEIFTSSEDLLYDELEKLKGLKIQDVIPDEVAAQHLEVIRKTIETQEKQIFEYQLDVKKGKCWFESRTSPIKGLQDGELLVASSVRDITRRKLAEKEIREKEKLAVVIETAGAVCHELNQPLHIITGCCELLEQETEVSENVRRKIEIILREVNRMAKLNHNLLNITSYKTKSYMEARIIDIQQASGKIL